MKYIKQIFALFLALCLSCMISGAVYAHAVPDLDRKGTVTVHMEYDGEAVTGGTLTAYRVGQIKEENGNYSFVKTEVMQDFPGSYKDIGSAALAEDIAAFVEENDLSACATAKNQKGKAVFADVEPGLYLIVQIKASEGFEPLTPFLVPVPMNEDGQYVYAVDAEGKCELHREQDSESPSTPKESSLPQTGQLNWPVPVLTVMGLCFFSMGWMLRFGRKKNGYEK